MKDITCPDYCLTIAIVVQCKVIIKKIANSYIFSRF